MSTKVVFTVNTTSFCKEPKQVAWWWRWIKHDVHWLIKILKKKKWSITGKQKLFLLAFCVFFGLQPFKQWAFGPTLQWAFCPTPQGAFGPTLRRAFSPTLQGAFRPTPWMSYKSQACVEKWLGRVAGRRGLTVRSVWRNMERGCMWMGDRGEGLYTSTDLVRREQ